MGLILRRRWSGAFRSSKKTAKTAKTKMEMRW